MAKSTNGPGSKKKTTRPTVGTKNGQTVAPKGYKMELVRKKGEPETKTKTIGSGPMSVSVKTPVGAYIPVPMEKEKKEAVAASITAEQQVPEIEIDAEIPLALVKPAFFNLLRQFEPFGPANMKPVFLTRGLYDYQGSSIVVKEQHLRIVAHQRNGAIIEGIGFGIGDKYELVRNGPFDMVYNIEENEHNGNTRLQVRVVDIKKSAS
jgi:hypothetical protein